MEVRRVASWTSRGSLSVVGNDLLQDTIDAQPILMLPEIQTYVIQKNIFSEPLRFEKQGGKVESRYSVQL